MIFGAELLMGQEMIKKPSHLVLGVALARGCMRLLMAKQKWRGLEVCKHAELDFPLNELQDPGRREDLKLLLNGWGLSQHSQPTSIRVIIPDHQTLMLEIEKGILDRSQGPDASRFEETTLFRPEEVYYDLQPLPANPKKQNLLLAKQDLVDDVCGLFTEFGLRVDHITSRQDLLARVVPGHIRLTNELIFVFWAEHSLVWSAYSHHKLIAASNLPRKTKDDALSLLRFACHEALAKLGSDAQPSIFLAGPGAEAAAKLLDKDASIQSERHLQLPVCVLKPEELLPPDLDWGFLSLYLALKNSWRKRGGFNLAPQPEGGSFWAQSSHTWELALAVGVLCLALAGQVVGQGLLVNHQARAVMEDLQGRLAQTRNKIATEEKKLAELDPLIQASISQQHFTPAFVEVIRKLPAQARLEKYQWKDGKAVMYVAGIDKKMVKTTFAHTGMMSLNGEPIALKPSQSGGQRWQVTMALRAAQKAPKQLPKKVKPSQKAPQLLDSIRPSTVQR